MAGHLSFGQSGLKEPYNEIIAGGQYTPHLASAAVCAPPVPGPLSHQPHPHVTVSLHPGSAWPRCDRTTDHRLGVDARAT
ncbi:BQ2448_5022 [Microbotryum intermedium]|uniref:BQ2448_5022 protein n=1 Tax=Microbotryum intermedium TaxID=269621 RepID=A0A238F5Y7_9BASI|nr:BQ2448_5022 [Microbotryum intermedium]